MPTDPARPTPEAPQADPPIPLPELLALRRWNTPTVYNGLEQYTKADRKGLVNLDEITDFMPQMGAMAGYAVTLVIEPSNEEHAERDPEGWKKFFRHVASVEGPKIIVCQDLDKPQTYGAAFGEVNCSTCRQLGCVGVIVDGACRDVDEMNYAGMKVLARRLSVSHCYSTPVRWGCEVEVCGIRVEPGTVDPRRQARVSGGASGRGAGAAGGGSVHGPERVRHADRRGPLLPRPPRAGRRGGLQRRGCLRSQCREEVRPVRRVGPVTRIGRSSEPGEYGFLHLELLSARS